jgi:hypothetical protein
MRLLLRTVVVVMVMVVSSKFPDLIFDYLLSQVVRLMPDGLSDCLGGLVELLLGLSDWAVPVLALKVIEGLVTCFIKLTVKYSQLHSYLRRRILLIKSVLLNDIDDNRALLGKRLEYLAVEELVSRLHLGLVESLKLLDLRLQLNALLFLHLFLLGNLPLLVHGLLLRVHVLIALKIIREIAYKRNDFDEEY